MSEGEAQAEVPRISTLAKAIQKTIPYVPEDSIGIGVSTSLERFYKAPWQAGVGLVTTKSVR